MVTVSLKREKQLNDKVKFTNTKSGDVKALIVTGLGVFVSGRLHDLSLYDAIKYHKDKEVSIDPNKRLNNDKIIDFQNSKKLQVKNKKGHETFSEWLSIYRDNNELREVFVNMDLAMKYIHGKGYCIKSFNPKEIEILNNSIDQIKYNTLLEMPSDFYDQKELVKEDIYNSAFLQIAIYLNCSTKRYRNQSIDEFLLTLKPSFLKENFDSFSTFIPEGDVPYYRGIIQRGSSVYFSDFVKEKGNRDLTALQKEVGNSADSFNTNTNTNLKGKSLVKTNGYGFGNYDTNDNKNDIINKSIYFQLNNKESAYIMSFVLPIIMVIVGLVLMALPFIISFG